MGGKEFDPQDVIKVAEEIIEPRYSVTIPNIHLKIFAVIMHSFEDGSSQDLGQRFDRALEDVGVEYRGASKVDMSESEVRFVGAKLEELSILDGSHVGSRQIKVLRSNFGIAKTKAKYVGFFRRITQKFKV